jgi:hypothetical protein
LKKKRKRKRLKPVTPRSEIKGRIDRIWFWSRERREKVRLLKLSGDWCDECEKVWEEIHHKEEAKINEIIDMIYETLLVPPEKLVGLCKECHNKKHPERIGT